MNSIPDQIVLGRCQRMEQHARVKEELRFSKWEFDLFVETGVSSEIVRITDAQALSWWHRFKRDEPTPPVIQFLRAFTPPYLVSLDKESDSKEFDPREWELLGSGSREWDWDGLDGLYRWTAEEFLFESDSTYLLVWKERHWEAPFGCGPYARFIDKDSAARWSILNNVPLAANLACHNPYRKLTPSDATQANTGSVPEDTSFAMNEVLPTEEYNGEDDIEIERSALTNRGSRKGLLHVSDSRLSQWLANDDFPQPLTQTGAQRFSLRAVNKWLIERGYSPLSID